MFETNEALKPHIAEYRRKKEEERIRKEREEKEAEEKRKREEEEQNKQAKIRARWDSGIGWTTQAYCTRRCRRIPIRPSTGFPR